MVIKNWQGVFIGVGIALIVGAVCLLIRILHKWSNKQQALSELKVMAKEMGATDIGYVNKNNQRNNGITPHEGTDNNQYFYEMECLNCGHKYYANGTDIWQRKCPACQGGRS